jgi:hypothetical protein
MKGRVMALAAISAVTLAGCFVPSPGQPTAVRRLVYGDSLTVDAQPYLAPYGSLGVRFAGGWAPCDALPGLTNDASAFAPQVVAIQFVGNLSSCMNGRDPQTGYEQDLTTIVTYWRQRGTPVVMVLSPKLPLDNWAFARYAEQNVANRLGIPIDNAGAAVELPDETWTAFLPCLPDEDAARGCGYEQAGEIRVREPTFGLHFGVSNADGTYSSGARRFADAIATGT